MSASLSHPSRKSFVGLVTAGLIAIAAMTPAFGASSSTAKPTISDEASTAVAQMGKTLLANQFSFQAHTIRVYAESDGQPLHIAHNIKVIVRRPDRLRVDVTGDDGSTQLFYDGKTVVLYGADAKKYASVAVPNTLEGMIQTVMGKMGVDFPLADFLTAAPDKAFLYGVTSGRQVGLATIDGVVCRHLLFTQPPGLELELWVENNERSLPRRLIVTYRSEAGEPSFIAELSDWNLDIQPTDADFVFQPPAGATQVEFKPASASAKGGGK
jgi:hypothetical protein